MTKKELQQIDFNIIRDEMFRLCEIQNDDMKSLLTLRKHGKKAEPVCDMKSDCYVIQKRINARQLVIDCVCELQDKLLNI